MRPASPPNYERAPVHSAESAATTFGDEERRLSQGTALPEQQRVAGRGRVAGYPSPPFLAASVRGGVWRIDREGYEPCRKPSTAGANTPWVGRFRVRDIRVAEDVLLAA